MTTEILSDIPIQLTSVPKGYAPGHYGFQAQSQEGEFLVFVGKESYLSDNAPDFESSQNGLFQTQFDTDGTEDIVVIMRSSSEQPVDIVHRSVPLDQDPGTSPQRKVSFKDEQEGDPNALAAYDDNSQYQLPQYPESNVSDSSNTSRNVIIGILLVVVVGYLVYNNMNSTSGAAKRRVFPQTKSFTPHNPFSGLKA